MPLATGLAYALLSLLLCAVAFSGGAPEAARPALSLGVVLLALAAAASPWLRARPGALAIALVWSAVGLLQLLWSAGPDAALNGAASVLASALVFLVAACAIPEEASRRWLVGFAVSGVAVACVALACAEPGVRASFPFGNPNHLAGWLLLPGAIAFAGMFRARLPWTGQRASVLWFCVLVIVSAGIALSGSRGAACAGAAAVCAFTALGRSGRAVKPLAAVWVAGAVAISVLPALAPDLLPPARNDGESSAGIRWQVYAASARAALEAAPTGAGLGGFTSSFAGERPVNLAYAPRYAHNELLHGVVELGVPFLFAIALTVWLVVRRASRERSGAQSIAAWGGGAALLAVSAHAVIDFSLHVPAIVLAAATLAGLTWSATRDAPARGVAATRLVLAGLSLVLVALSGTHALALRAESKAQARLAAGDFAGAESEARRGLRVRPARPDLHRVIAEAAEHSHALAAGGVEALARALAAREAAARAGGRRSELQLELARARARMGDRLGAVEASDRAIALDPVAPGLHLARARLLLSLAREREATESVRKALVLRPIAAGDVIEALLHASLDPTLVPEAVPEISDAKVRSALALSRAGYREVAAGEFERALALAPGDPQVALAAARNLREAGDPHGAVAILAQSLERLPDHPRLASELERLRATLGRGPS